ncbi:MAG TPA: BatA domain-containing protein, partial [Xanthobacteraceae bacterium]|nr:BatA domain-containing protein [Xanthobacteraceae bacterium]
MIAGLPLGFAEPLVLFGLLSLPVLWWLLRLIPPRPRRIDFPPTRLLFDIAPRDETPSRTPWWLTALRLTLAALMIFAAAGPLWDPPLATATRAAPIAMLIDDTWAAAASWDARMRTAEDIVSRAETDNRGIAVFALSETMRDISLETPGAARIRLRQIKPKPYTIDRSEALAPITRFLTATPDVEMIWLSDGVDLGRTSDFVEALARAAGQRPVTMIEGGLKQAHALSAAENAAGALTVNILRAAAAPDDAGTVRALDLKGLPLGEARFVFKNDERVAEARFDLPVELRNDIARLEIADERSAGAVQLLDKRWRRRTIGVVSGATTDTAQPLLASTYYLSRALNPFADIRLAEAGAPSEAIKQFVDQNLPMLIVADVGNIVGETHDRLNRWIENGGVLVRFAGPRLAASDDELVPVKLRRGGRILGGSLSWEQPQQLAAFSRESPFAGMTVPNDVTVNRQVLAEPDSELSDRTWAALVDGTPLVTARRYGKGAIVLFHVTADTRWSNLPLSGAFVEMLKRIVGLSGTSTASEAKSTESAKGTRDAVPATRLLDGFGAFGPPPSTARPLSTGFAGRATADHPPGFYGPPEGLVAVNTLAPADQLNPIDAGPLHARVEPYRVREPKDLRGPVFLSALALLLVDALVVFWLAGGLYRLLPRRGIAVSVFVAIMIAALSLSANRTSAAERNNDDFAMKSSLQTKFAYVVTG